MAELQWIVEVRCTNALLAEMKVGEKGEHVIVNIPDMSFDPSEFDKLIQGLEVSNRIAEENRRLCEKPQAARSHVHTGARSGKNVEIMDERDLYKLKILKTGEMVSVNVPDMLFAPSELDRFVAELKAVKSKMEELRKRVSASRRS